MEKTHITFVLRHINVTLWAFGCALKFIMKMNTCELFRFHLQLERNAIHIF